MIETVRPNYRTESCKIPFFHCNHAHIASLLLFIPSSHLSFLPFSFLPLIPSLHDYAVNPSGVEALLSPRSPRESICENAQNLL